MDSSVLDYILPEERIARFPAQKRDESKLLVFDRKTQKIIHSIFKELPSFLPNKFNIFRNDAAVLKARIFAKKDTGANVECLLLTPIENNKWNCMLRPAKRLKNGAIFGVENVFSATVLEHLENGNCIVDFNLAPRFNNAVEMAEEIGVVPLPPYIRRNQNSPDYDRNFDNNRYETVYANSQKRVAAAAPTAGLHFTDKLISTMKSYGHVFNNLTLHVGIGTFQPLKTDVIEEHSMHGELYEIPTSTLEALANTSLPKLAVGTTSLRAIEDFSRKNVGKKIDVTKPVIDTASLFVYPPQRVISADAMITNFHLPRSTLMCLVSTFLTPESNAGIELLKGIYSEAIEKEYNFYSYGDAMLIL
ncbi:MAG: tRNA preQ1(34) S-adenosylmethionine ribosyltransferase-isomerase QueA [Opitutales bacterium]|nr:tRNA preQ1(34) S-adenosylmethionine ribosyltransferase-isomerase QueA [Opitutales bacterium]